MNLRGLHPPLTFSALFCSALVAGCGASGAATRPLPAAAPPEPAAEPLPASTEAETPPGELDALEHELQVSEQDLDRCLAQRAPPVASPPAATAESDAAEEAAEEQKPAVATARAPKRAAAVARAGPVQAGEPAEAVSEGSVSPCASACRALASMQNSAGRLCSLTGRSHERCVNAQARVAGADQRVKTAGCACQTETP